MRLAVGSDHAGFSLKQDLIGVLGSLGHEVVDVGTYSAEPVDYPDFAAAVARAILDGRATRGVLICGSGVGASIAVNKIRGIRGGLCHDSYSAHQAVEHDDINVLILGARVIGIELARELLRHFVAATFTGEDRHVRRLAKVADLEAGLMPADKPSVTP